MKMFVELVTANLIETRSFGEGSSFILYFDNPKGFGKLKVLHGSICADILQQELLRKKTNENRDSKRKYNR
jgi:hypothetical protein